MVGFNLTPAYSKALLIVLLLMSPSVAQTDMGPPVRLQSSEIEESVASP